MEYTTNCTLLRVGIALSVMAVLTAGRGVSAYAASPAEGAVNIALQQPAESQSVLLRDVPVEVSDGVTVKDYLQDIEKELMRLEENKLMPGSSSEGYLFDDCIDIAIKRHLPIEIAQDKISLHRRRLIRALRELFPSLNLSYEHDKGFKLLKADTIPGDHSNQWFRSERWRMSLSQPLFRGGALWNKVNEERANVRAARAEYDKVFLDLSLEVARAYFNYAKGKTMLGYKENVQTIANDAEKISAEKMEAALISEIEHLNVQSQQSQIQHDLEAAKEDVALALLEVQKVLHLDVTEPIEVMPLEGIYSAAVDEDLARHASEADMDEKEKENRLNRLIDLAYENRPEFIIQKNKVDAATYRYKIAVGGWFPQMNLQYEQGQKAEAYIEDDNNPPWDVENHIMFDTKWNLAGNTLRYTYDKNRQATGVEATEPVAGIGKDGYYDRRNTVSIALLDGLDQFSQTKEAEISRKEALLELELSEKDIVSEVKESFYNYNRALVQLRSVNKRLAYRQKLVELAKHRSEINEIQLSEYLQSEMDLINERDNLYKAMVDYFLAKVSLNKAIGVKDYMPIKVERRDTTAA